MFDLTGKTALVTGATGGIGAEIAKALAAQGARVIATGRREEALDALVAEIGAAQCDKIVADLAEADAPDLMIKAAEAIAPLDILVCNAGITRDQLAMRMKDEDWQTVLDVNLTSSFRLIRSSLRGMMKRRQGRIIAISSIVGATGGPGQANYAASKAGLIGMCKAIAQEVAARNITVNAIAPGFIETAMTDILNEKQKTSILDRVPSGRMGTPDEIAAMTVYLASKEAGYVTGQTLHINGGLAMP